MRLIARSTLAKYWKLHPETQSMLQRWITIVGASDWRKTSDVVATFANAKTINRERVRFEVHGGDYRLVVAFNFETGVAFVKFIGTHAEYDRIDAATVRSY
jgi:mRNA interferase HigB